MKTKLFFLSVLVMGVLSFGVPAAHAQAIGCTNLVSDVSYGAHDAGTNGEVTTLQIFLNYKGYLSVAPTGYFGPLTRTAATSFQRDNGISTTGYVGPITRGRIESLTCGAVPPSPTVSISSLVPSQGPIGSVVTVNGQGFTSDSLVHFGPGVIGAITFINSDTLQFTVPNAIGPYCKPGMACPMYMARITTPGNYNVSVENNNGTSNPVNFYVTDQSSSIFSITGLDAPSSLPVGTTGTWTVHVSNPGSSNLHYSVVWGDENPMIAASQIVAPQPTTIQSSATFTHTYRTTGSFTPRFTVADDNNHTANTSASVVVTPIY